MKYTILLAALLFFLPGCVSSGPRYIDLAYSQDRPAKTAVHRAGLARFVDRRPHSPKGQVGFRVLLNNNRETFVVTGMDLAAAMTRVTRTYLEHTGYTVAPVPAWPLTPGGVADASGDFTHLFAGGDQPVPMPGKKDRRHHRHGPDH